jgi:hypothetical protein
MDAYQRILLYATLFGVFVIALWVTQWINKRKAEKRRIVIKTGPKIERFVDPAKAVRADVVYTKDESSVKARHWWDQCGLSEGICGVCNRTINNPDGYIIPISMVVKSPTYLAIAAKPIMEFGIPQDKAVEQVKEQLLAEKMPWLVCEACAGHFFK